MFICCKRKKKKNVFIKFEIWRKIWRPFFKLPTVILRANGGRQVYRQIKAVFIVIILRLCINLIFLSRSHQDETERRFIKHYYILHTIKNWVEIWRKFWRLPFASSIMVHTFFFLYQYTTARAIFQPILRHRFL